MCDDLKNAVVDGDWIYTLNDKGVNNVWMQVSADGGDKKRAAGIADHIVRCVNAHDDMLEALKEAILYVNNDETRDMIRAAIKKARGEK